MRFGPLPLDAAEGALLAHSQRIGDERLAKGSTLTAAHIAAAREAGMETLVVARLDPGDVAEDQVAARIGAALAGPGIRAGAPAHGRVNLHADADGLAGFDPAAIAALNGVDEAITLATLQPFARVAAEGLVATIKIIPYAVAEPLVAAAERQAQAATIRLHRFASGRIDLVHTLLPGTGEKAIAKAARVIAARVAALGSAIVHETRCAHDVAALAGRLSRPGDATITLIVAASATVDRRDVVPAAIVAAGGTVERVGMPVDPGNLLCFGRIGGRTVIGLPGCARSPRRNGIDLVLERLLAGLPLDAAAIGAMGVGGLLAEAGDRPQPREPRPAPRRGTVQPIILAAGRATRMGATKLAADLNGRPIIAHVAAAIAEAGLPPPILVLGHDADVVRAAWGNRPARFVIAADHGEGLSRSLAHGIAALPEDALAALVCLGDMPFVPAALLRDMAALATPDAIVVPRVDGRPGNPVLWGRTYFARLASLSGDVGGRALMAEFADAVRFLDCDAPGIRIDIDTPQALAAARAGELLPVR